MKKLLIFLTTITIVSQTNAFNISEEVLCQPNGYLVNDESEFAKQFILKHSAFVFYTESLSVGESGISIEQKHGKKVDCNGYQGYLYAVAKYKCIKNSSGYARYLFTDIKTNCVIDKPLNNESLMKHLMTKKCDPQERTSEKRFCRNGFWVNLETFKNTYDFN